MIKRPRIALFLHYLNDQFQIAVYKGIKDKAKELGFDIFCIQGAKLASQVPELSHPFGILQQVPFDGALILSSVIFGADLNNAFREVKDFFGDLPCVSIGLKVPEMTSILVRNRGSMVKIMDHLILEHGYRKLLFIAGPRKHHDSAVREQVFRHSVELYKQKFPALEASVQYGDFFEESALRIMRSHLQRNPNAYFDAVVAANDNMAIGVLKALRLQDDPRWTHCAVTGFDDIPQGALEIPALTSVHQPMRKMGTLATEILHEKLLGLNTQQVYYIESKPMLRESCGCSALKKVEEENPASYSSRIVQLQRASTESERRLRLASDFSQNIVSIMSMKELLFNLRDFLSNLNVRTFYLLTFEMPGRNIHQLAASVRLLYFRRNEKDRFFDEKDLVINLDEFFRLYLAPEKESSYFTLYHLHSSEEKLGLIVYEAEGEMHSYINTITLHLANALMHLKVLDEQAKKAKQLEEQVNMNARDLGLINDLLEEEVRRRRRFEMELLRQREMLESILDATPVPVIVHSINSGTLRYANKAFNALLGSTDTGEKNISTFLKIPDQNVGREHIFHSPFGDIPVLVYTARLLFEGEECCVTELIDLRHQKTLESDVLTISEFERRRFGLDLHDDICQRLAGISIYGKALAQGIKNLEPDQVQKLEEISSLIDETLNRTRDYAHASFPVELEDLGLEPVLKNLCESISRQSRVSCTFESLCQQGSPQLSKEQEINLYRIVQESLQNSIKHSKASKICVCLDFQEEHWELTVSDNGIGDPILSSEFWDLPSPDKEFRHGLGLRSMRYRASQLGGRIEILSRKESGTTIKIEVPKPS